jgi:hypothetical protein
MRLAGGPELAADHRTGRHFYDIHQLLGDSRVIDFLGKRDEVGQVIEEVAEITQAHFTKTDQPTEVRPKDGFAGSPAFDLNSNVSERLRTAYEETMPQLYFGTDPLPSWEAIAGRVIQHRNLL